MQTFDSEVFAEDEKDFPKYSYMVRRCEYYKEENKDCRSMKGSFQHYFIHGTKSDCRQWKLDYENCMKYRNDKDMDALQEVILSEKKRFTDRMQPHLENDVWERRKSPPENWNSPLPPEMVEEYENSALTKIIQENGGKLKDVIPVPTSLCIIL